MKVKQFFVLILSVGAITAGVFLGYRMFVPHTEPIEEEPPVEEVVDEVETDEVLDDIEEDITLPGELRRSIGEHRARRDGLYEAAQTAHRAGNLTEADNLYRDVITLSPRDRIAANSYRYLGDIAAAREQYSRALQFYSMALDIVDDAAVFYYRRGLVQSELDDYEESRQSLSEAISIQADPDFYMARGNIAFERGFFEDAVADYIAAIDLEKRQEFYLNLGLAYQRLGQSSQAIEAYENMLAMDVPDPQRYTVAMNLGRLYYDKQEPNQALRMFEVARDINPTASAYYNLGQARIMDNNYPGAADALEESAAIDPANYSIFVDLGYVYEQMENYINSIHAYERALEIKPEETALLYALGRLNELADRPDRALVYYRRLIEREEGEELAVVYRRVGEILLDRGQARRAIAPLRNASLLDPFDHQTRYNLGIAYFRTEQQQDAISEFESAVEEDTDSVRYRQALAEVLFESGFYERSLQQYEEILQIEPEHFESIYMIGLIHYRRGETAAALRRFQNLVDRTDDDYWLMRLYQNLGNVYILEERYTEARTSFRQAIAIEENPDVFYNLGLVYIYEEEWEKAAASLRYARDNLEENSKIRAALGFVFYTLGIYDRAVAELQRAVELDPEHTRAHYDLRMARQQLDSENN